MALAFKSHPLRDHLTPPTPLFLHLSEKNSGGLLILVWGCRGNGIPCEMRCHNISALFRTLKDTASSFPASAQLSNGRGRAEGGAGGEEPGRAPASDKSACVPRGLASMGGLEGEGPSSGSWPWQCALLW